MTSKLEVLQKNKELPKGWISSNLGNFLIPIKGKKPKTLGEKNSKYTIPYINIKAFEKNIIEQYTDDMQCPQCSKDDVLMVWDGARSGLVGTGIKGAIGSTLSKLLIPHINSKYLFYFLQSKYHFINKNTKGVGIPHVNPNILANIEFPIPPVNEQKRIVDKIEVLFSELDSAFDALRRTQLQLKSYKLSLLKDGFVGELTKNWRKNNSYDSVEQLMGKIKNNHNRQEKKLQEIQLPEDYKYFHQIPNSWKWVRVGNVCLRMQYGTSEKANGDSSGIPVLRMGNIIDGELNYDDLKFFPKNWSDKDEFLLEPGDVLFNRTNSAELVGKTAVFGDTHPPSVFASYLIRTKVASEIILPKILVHYTNSIFGRMFIKSVVSQQVGQANVNGTKYSMMCIPLIPMSEQVELIYKIETGISLIQNVSKEVDIRLQSLVSLRSSILKQVFEGKLVPQDPNDEPASVLIAKIKQKGEVNKK